MLQSTAFYEKGEGGGGCYLEHRYMKFSKIVKFMLLSKYIFCTVFVLDSLGDKI